MMNYKTMFDFEVEAFNKGFKISWKATSDAYEAAHVRYLLVNPNIGSRVASLVFCSGEYEVIRDDLFDDHERAMLAFLASQYQEDCDLYEGDHLVVDRANP